MATIVVRSGAALVAAVLAAAAVLDRLPAPQPGDAARTRVIIQAAAGHSASELAPVVERMGGTMGPALDIINAQVAVLPDAAIAEITRHPAVMRLSRDRAVAGTMERTAATVGALAVRETFGYDGAGVGIAIIDSGVTPWHDDLASADGGQRIARFVDLVGNRPNAYDDYGHGTHVAGIIAGDGFDSGGARTGIAPGARLTVFKVLDDQGNGRISDVIAAFDYILKRHDTLNIRVVNLSVASGVHESYNTDALAVAAKRLVEAGIVVVAAAGNRGQTATGNDAYGGITSPGNAPWVLTVGASNHMGSVARDDDRMAEFSSRGPTPIDLAAKPDLVAPGVGIESLSNVDSTFYRVLSPFLLEGTVPRGYLPYLSLTGTSMAAPVVTGTIALMLQANPALTPNAVKAILQYTAEVNRGYDPLTQGGGFLNAAGAVELARTFASGAAINGSTQASWSRTVIWGNQLTRTSALPNDAGRWAASVMWGAAAGSLNGTGDPRNVVWGKRCGGSDCREAWTLAAAHDESVVWGTNADESVVWGTTTQDESVVWGTTVRQRH